MKQKGLLEILCLGLLWGPSFLFTKMALIDLSPLTVVSLRVGLGVLLLYVVLKIKKTTLPRDFKLWRQCFVLGFFVNGFPWICYSFAVERIPTSLAALINGTTPVLTVLLANIFFEDEPLTWNRALGVVIGLLGFVVLFLPKLFNQDIELDVIGMLLSFIGAACYAIGIVYARTQAQKAPPLVIPTLQLLTSLMYIIPLAFIFESPFNAVNASFSAWSAIMGLAVMGTLLAYILYYHIVAKYGATALSMVTYLLPIFGTILGVTFLQETITLDFYIATFLILSGVMIMNGAIRLPSRLRRI